MPLYICNAKKDALDATAKQAIAGDITDIHCSVTGAPACFVHVAFFEEEPAPESNSKSLVVLGTIRKGRIEENKQDIVQAIENSLATHGAIALADVEAHIRETPAS